MSFTSRANISDWRFDVDVNGTGKLLVSGTPALVALEVDNTQNSIDVFLKIWDKATAPVIGTDDPDIVIRVSAGTKLVVPYPSDGDGVLFINPMYVACVTTGGTTGTTSPPNTVTATIYVI